MDFISIEFWLFLVIAAVLYYTVPMKHRWVVLLGGSIYYYARSAGWALGCILFTVVFTWIMGRAIEKYHSRLLLWTGVVIDLCPLIFFKFGTDLTGMTSIAMPLGISFYTLQMIAYLADIYHRKYRAESGVMKFVLFGMFFPQVLQGPIPRYEQLSGQLYRGNRFEYRNLVYGVQLFLWGAFLKLVIADRAGIVVDTVYGNADYYAGMYYLVAGLLYSVQIYTDFLACVCMARGVGSLFGVHMAENFDHPYFAVSVKDFWRRWHISLSSWLRDYIYIPLGGNRKGTLRRYVNLMITFLVSGIWHGSGLNFLVWGALHGFYQIAGDLKKTLTIRGTAGKDLKAETNARETAQTDLKAETNTEETVLKAETNAGETVRTGLWVNRLVTFLLVTFGWIIFRAENLTQGLHMIKSIFTVGNVWIFFDESLLTLGLDWREWVLLLMGCLILLAVELMQEKQKVRDIIAKWPAVCRGILFVAGFLTVAVFGVYGFGFDPNSFIYGGF